MMMSRVSNFSSLFRARRSPSRSTIFTDDDEEREQRGTKKRSRKELEEEQDWDRKRHRGDRSSKEVSFLELCTYLVTFPKKKQFFICQEQPLRDGEHRKELPVTSQQSSSSSFLSSSSGGGGSCSSSSSTPWEIMEKKLRKRLKREHRKKTAKQNAKVIVQMLTLAKLDYAKLEDAFVKRSVGS